MNGNPVFREEEEQEIRVLMNDNSWCAFSYKQPQISILFA